jgi:hypothetical protein
MPGPAETINLLESVIINLPESVAFMPGHETEWPEN